MKCFVPMSALFCLIPNQLLVDFLKTIGFCTFNFVPILLTSLFVSSNFSAQSFRFSSYVTESSANSDHFSSFFAMSITRIFLFCLSVWLLSLIHEVIYKCFYTS